ncbi:MAG TPA: acyl-CoA thioesterase domain-containing protein, partial [Mycobacterium sp.]|nr:acyl-CoA thioesterase domain-containing protein [Mycobacterium sp.]
MLDLWTDLLGCLDLHIEHERSESDNVTVFEGVSQQLDYHRVFGGQLLGQVIRAASLSCPDKTVKSLHAVFAREGRAGEPVRYQATRQHEGRSFASLTITAQQPHAVLASSSVSLHTVEDGPENQDCQAVPAPLDETHRVELDLIPWETR